MGVVGRGRGKTVTGYSPSMNMGGYVVVVNAEKVLVTGRKTDQKMYRRHSGRPGGLKEETFRQLQKVMSILGRLRQESFNWVDESVTLGPNCRLGQAPEAGS